MLESLALMVLCSILLSSLMQKLKLPGLIGMLLTGIIVYGKIKIHKIAG